MFITFEGLDGAGKSTQIQRLRMRLEASGRKVTCTREPGGTVIGERIRALLLNPEDTICPQTEVLLYAASRAELVQNVIRPALTRREVVFCDRYVDASLAYQGAGLGMGIDEVRRINQYATGELVPDLTFLFDLPVQVSKERILHSGRPTKPDRIEQRDVEYFNRVRDAFMQIAQKEPNRVLLLDATNSPDILEEEIWRMTTKYLAKAGLMLDRG